MRHPQLNCVHCRSIHTLHTTVFTNHRVRAAYKAVQSPKDLQKELPQCALGSLLLTWIKTVRDRSISECVDVRDAEALKPHFGVYWLLWLARLCHCTARLCGMGTYQQALCGQSLVSKQCVLTLECVTLSPLCWHVGMCVQVRAVARKAAALREAEKQLAAAEADKTA